MNQALNAKKLFVSLMSTAVLSVLLLVPFSASAVTAKIGSTPATSAGTNVVFMGCKQYAGSSVTVRVSAKATNLNALKGSRYLQVQMIQVPPSGAIGVAVLQRASDKTWDKSTRSTTAAATAKRGSLARVALVSGTEAYFVSISSSYNYKTKTYYNASFIDPAKLPNC